MRGRPCATTALAPCRQVLLVAHPTRSGEMLAWARGQHHVLRDLESFQLFADDATRAAIAGELRLPAAELRSYSPRPGHGGGAREAGADLLVLFWDPGEPQPRDTDVRALLAAAVRQHVSLACTPRAADFLLLASPRHDELAPLLPWLDERRWAPELALTAARPSPESSYPDEPLLRGRRGLLECCA